MKIINKAISNLPAGETYKRIYRAFEGDLRMISADPSGREYRYRINETDGTIDRF